MKTIVSKRIWLLISAIILVSVFITLIPASRAYAGNVQLNATSLTLYRKGGTKSFQLILYDDDQPVAAVWKSSRKRVASVSANGFVKAKRYGTTKITATYAGVKYTCKVKVRTKSGTYKNCIKAYKKFLMNPYVTYTTRGARAQADNFCSIDLDCNGMPELLVNVVANGLRYHVLYHYTDNKMSTGQILGACADFIWYPSVRVVNFRKIEPDQTLQIWSRDNGTTLNSMAILRSRHNRQYYYISDGSMTSYGTQVPALEFRNYVDHDILGYSKSKALTFRVNTPSNRSRYLK